MKGRCTLTTVKGKNNKDAAMLNIIPTAIMAALVSTTYLFSSHAAGITIVPLANEEQQQYVTFVPVPKPSLTAPAVLGRNRLVVRKKPQNVIFTVSKTQLLPVYRTRIMRCKEKRDIQFAVKFTFCVIKNGTDNTDNFAVNVETGKVCRLPRSGGGVGAYIQDGVTDVSSMKFVSNPGTNILESEQDDVSWYYHRALFEFNPDTCQSTFLEKYVWKTK